MTNAEVQENKQFVEFVEKEVFIFFLEGSLDTSSNDVFQQQLLKAMLFQIFQLLEEYFQESDELEELVTETVDGVSSEILETEISLDILRRIFKKRSFEDELQIIKETLQDLRKLIIKTI